jgi:hypothetical protein
MFADLTPESSKRCNLFCELDSDILKLEETRIGTGQTAMEANAI